jgi:hypothetical protein
MNPRAPRLQDKAGICAYLGNISSATYDNWHAKGIVPGPVPGTNRYDLRAHDAMLDRVAGIDELPSNFSPMEDFEAAYLSGKH